MQGVCEVCGGKGLELRRGRCWGCYNRWTEARPVGLNAACTVCEERRKGFLKQIELLGAWVPMCHNCAGRAMQLLPAPTSLAEIKKRLSRERRNGERRIGKKDTRVFPRERRVVASRRSPKRLETLPLGDESIILDDELLPEKGTQKHAENETRIVQKISS
jgi:hypothetical protein